MIQKFSIYKGLQKPLVYRGFKGKFIAWGIASLVAGLLVGGAMVALVNMYVGAFLMLAIISGGLAFTFHSQRSGLHSKTKNRGIIIYANLLKIRYEGKAKCI